MIYLTDRMCWTSAYLSDRSLEEKSTAVHIAIHPRLVFAGVVADDRLFPQHQQLLHGVRGPQVQEARALVVRGPIVLQHHLRLFRPRIVRTQTESSYIEKGGERTKKKRKKKKKKEKKKKKKMAERGKGGVLLSFSTLGSKALEHICFGFRRFLFFYSGEKLVILRCFCCFSIPYMIY